MTEAVEIGDDHTRVRLHSSQDPYCDGYEFRSFTVHVEAPGITAATAVTNIEDGATSLVRFFDDLATNWRGWSGERTWEALEHQLAIGATHDLVGHVTFRFTLRESVSSDAWIAAVTVTVKAGEEILRLARDIRGFLKD